MKSKLAEAVVTLGIVTISVTTIIIGASLLQEDAQAPLNYVVEYNCLEELQKKRDQAAAVCIYNMQKDRPDLIDAEIIEMCTRQAKRNWCSRHIYKLSHRKLWLKPIKSERLLP